MKFFKTPTSEGFEDIRNRFHRLRAFTEYDGTDQMENLETSLQKWQSDINYQIAEEPGTLLHTAVRIECEKTVSVLIKYGAIIDMPALRSLQTPLHHSVIISHEKIINLLLQKGANPNSTDFAKFTPLHMACLNMAAKIVKILLEYGANMYLKIDAKFVTSNHLPYNDGQKYSALEVVMVSDLENIACMKTILYHEHIENFGQKIPQSVHPTSNKDFLKYLSNVISMNNEIEDLILN